MRPITQFTYARKLRGAGSRFLVIAVLGLAGCVAAGPSRSNVDRLQEGSTTYDQAVAMLGKPYHLDGRGGRLLAMWTPDGARRGVVIVFNEKGVAEEIKR
jgi:hypothetical protein